MLKKLFLLTLFAFPCVFINAQENNLKKNTKTQKKIKYKKVQRPVICNINKSDEIKSLSEGKIINPWKLQTIKKEISGFTSCGAENIYIISGVSKGGAAEYTACACGIKVLYKADYGMRIFSVTNITETTIEPR